MDGDVYLDQARVGPGGMYLIPQECASSSSGAEIEGRLMV
jgi:hypothetical protein